MKQAVLFLCLGLLAWGLFHSSFDEVYGPLLSEPSAPASSETLLTLGQPFRYLGKGRQSVAFASEDGKWVLKFFNQKYFKVPFWASIFPKFRATREKRRAYYRESYQIAAELFQEETGIVYLHQGLSPTTLPSVFIEDRHGKAFQVDLNGLPFVLQKRAEPFYPSLEALDPSGFGEALDQFVSLIQARIGQGIGDGDHNVENNFGMLHGRIVHIDPGRLHRAAQPWEREKIKYEWWSATHAFRKWLEKRHPEHLSRFDNAIETNLQKALQRSPTSPSLQKDEPPQG